MDTLAEVAHRLGKQGESKQWKSRADDLLQKLLAAYWKKDHFIALRPIDHSAIESDSLLLYIPIVLGKQLPPEVRSAVIADLKKDGAFLSPNGLATGATQQPLLPDKRILAWADLGSVYHDHCRGSGGCRRNRIRARTKIAILPHGRQQRFFRKLRRSFRAGPG